MIGSFLQCLDSTVGQKTSAHEKKINVIELTAKVEELFNVHWSAASLVDHMKIKKRKISKRENKTDKAGIWKKTQFHKPGSPR